MGLRSGQCLCGKVTVRGDVADEAQACHCTQCQRWTGGGPLFAVRIRDAEVSGEQNILSYTHSSWGERAVCGTCGSTLYWKMQGKPVAFVALGMLDDQSGIRVTEEIFVDSRPEWFPPFEGAAQKTEAEMKAALEEYLAKQEAGA